MEMIYRIVEVPIFQYIAFGIICFIGGVRVGMTWGNRGDKKMRLIDADKLNRKDVNCANVPMNFIDTAPTVEAIPKDQINKAIEKIEQYICDVETDTVKAQGMAQALDMFEQTLGGLEDGKID